MSDARASLGRLEIGFARLQKQMARIEERLLHMEQRFEVKLARLEEPLDAKIDRLAAILEATLPHLAAKADIAVLPTKTHLWGVFGVLVTTILGAIGAGLAAISILH